MARIFVDLLSYTGTKGGMEKYTRELYRSLGAMRTGHEFVGFASRELMELDSSWFPGDLISSGISGENRFAWARGELFAVSPAATRAGADLVHSPATLGPRRTSMPAVYTMHDMMYFAFPEMMVVKAYNKPVQWMEKAAAKNAARIITDSHASAEDIVKYLKFPADRIDVVHLAGLPPRLETAGKGGREPMHFLAMGQRIGHKNFESLIRALQHIPESSRPVVTIAGGRVPDPLAAVVAETGMGDWVQLRSWIPDAEVAWLLNHATALVVPSFHDGFSLPALEAMQVGMPVLLSDIPILREIGGDAAGYFDPHDTSSIARTLQKAMSEPRWLKSLSAQGQLRAKEFTWEKVARLTLASFHRALEAS